MHRKILLGAMLASLSAPVAFAATAPVVGGAAMYPSKTIVQNASKASTLTTLVAAVKAGGLVDTLSGKGPFTVFAPTNDAFAALPPGTVDTLLKPENKAQLDKVLTYHVVPGRLSTKALKSMVTKGGGTATLTTVQGDPLTVTDPDGKLMVTDEAGHAAGITVANVAQSNGMVQVIDKVLMPR